MKNKKGITLIALVITIIILLILAGVAISLIIGENGIIAKAQQAGKNYLDAQEKEKMLLSNLELENNIGSSRDDVITMTPEQYNKLKQDITEDIVSNLNLREVLWNGNSSETRTMTVDWQKYRYIIFYCNDVDDDGISGSLTSQIYDTVTLKNMMDKGAGNPIQIMGYDTHYIHLNVVNDGFTVSDATSYNGSEVYYLKRIVGVY